MEVTVSALKKVMGAKEVFEEFGIYIYMFNNIYIYIYILGGGFKYFCFYPYLGK